MSPLCLFEDSLLDLPQRASRVSPASLAIPSLLPVTDTEHGAPSWSAVARQGLSMVLDTISLAEVRDTHLCSGKDAPSRLKTQRQAEWKSPMTWKLGSPLSLGNVSELNWSLYCEKGPSSALGLLAPFSQLTAHSAPCSEVGTGRDLGCTRPCGYTREGHRVRTKGAGDVF